MGRIKGTIIKRSSKDLILYNKDKFGTEFGSNKKVVLSILPDINKKFLNKAPE